MRFKTKEQGLQPIKREDLSLLTYTQKIKELDHKAWLMMAVQGKSFRDNLFYLGVDLIRRNDSSSMSHLSRGLFRT
jgi:hypothetical protein